MSAREALRDSFEFKRIALDGTIAYPIESRIVSLEAQGARRARGPRSPARARVYTRRGEKHHATALGVKVNTHSSQVSLFYFSRVSGSGLSALSRSPLVSLRSTSGPVRRLSCDDCVSHGCRACVQCFRWLR